MAIQKRKPRSSALRFQSYLTTKDITKKTPERSLHRGGGCKRKYRYIDFGRQERDVQGTIIAVEYDPNRNVRLGLVSYKNGAKRYILLPEGLAVGSVVIAGATVEAKPGNATMLKNIPAGFVVHNVEIRPGSGVLVLQFELLVKMKTMLS
jgi:large subunit ribosomal protein L2